MKRLKYKKILFFIVLSMNMIHVHANRAVQSQEAQFWQNKINELATQKRRETNSEIKEKIEDEIKKYEKFLNLRVGQDQALIAQYGSLQNAEKEINQPFTGWIDQELEQKKAAQQKRRLIACTVAACTILTAAIYTHCVCRFKSFLNWSFT